MQLGAVSWLLLLPCGCLQPISVLPFQHFQFLLYQYAMPHCKHFSVLLSRCPAPVLAPSLLISSSILASPDISCRVLPACLPADYACLLSLLCKGQGGEGAVEGLLLLLFAFLFVFHFQLTPTYLGAT